MVESTLRGRKKAKTRQAIVDAAHSLFIHVGFDQTTLEDICLEAGVHVQTLLRHFRSKEDLALWRQIEGLEAFRAGLTNPEHSADVIAYWREFILSIAADRESNSYLAYVNVLESTPSLRARYRDLQGEYENLIAHALQHQAGGKNRIDLHARAKAATLVAVHFSIARALIADGIHSNVGLACLAATDAVLLHFPPPEDLPEVS